MNRCTRFPARRTWHSGKPVHSGSTCRRIELPTRIPRRTRRRRTPAPFHSTFPIDRTRSATGTMRPHRNESARRVDRTSGSTYRCPHHRPPHRRRSKLRRRNPTPEEQRPTHTRRNAKPSSHKDTESAPATRSCRSILVPVYPGVGVIEVQISREFRTLIAAAAQFSIGRGRAMSPRRRLRR